MNYAFASVVLVKLILTKWSVHGIASVTKSLFLQVGLHRKVPAITSLGRNDFE